MFLIYIDEAGDPGFPGSSDTFINTAIQIGAEKWNIIDESITRFREELSRTSKLPSNMEFHTKHIILRKRPYCDLGLSKIEIKEILIQYAKFISSLNLLCTTVVIDKTKLVKEIDVFEMGINRLVNRLNTTISVKYKKMSFRDKFFLIFCDQGRIQDWESIIRRMRSSNELYSSKNHKKINISLKKLVEKPVQRQSHKSNLLQVADFVATIFHYHYKHEFLKQPLASRQKYMNKEFIDEILEILKPIINLDANKKNDQGLVIFP